MGSLGRMLYPAAARIVGALEAADKPFSGVGLSLKMAVGWFAVATILTSLLVLAVAALK
jgi:hypothetical protein